MTASIATGLVDVTVGVGCASLAFSSVPVVPRVLQQVFLATSAMTTSAMKATTIMAPAIAIISVPVGHSLELPGVQGWHSVEAFTLENRPTGHSSHQEDPLALAARPGIQSMQDVREPSSYCPGSQLRQYDIPELAA